MTKILKGLVEKVEKDGTLSVAVATDSSVDRDGERIDPNGWDFNNYLKNPVLLWAHDYRQEPIGKVVSIVKDGDRILFKPQFAIDISPTAKRIFELFQKGFLNAFSVGFIPREWKDEDGNDGKRVRTFTRAELLEISAVPVPANANALVIARGMAKEKGIGDIETLSLEDAEAIAAKAAEKKDGEGEPEKPAEETPAPAAPVAPEGTSEELKTYISEVVAHAVAERSTELEATLKTFLESSIAGIKTDVESMGKAIAEKVEGESGIDMSKRVLQTIDKAIGEGLRLIRESKSNK